MAITVLPGPIDQLTSGILAGSRLAALHIQSKQAKQENKLREKQLGISLQRLAVEERVANSRMELDKLQGELAGERLKLARMEVEAGTEKSRAETEAVRASITQKERDLALKERQLDEEREIADQSFELSERQVDIQERVADAGIQRDLEALHINMIDALTRAQGVEVQREGLEVQREGQDIERERVGVQREGVAVQREGVDVQKQLAEARTRALELQERAFQAGVPRQAADILEGAIDVSDLTPTPEEAADLVDSMMPGLTKQLGIQDTPAQRKLLTETVLGRWTQMLAEIDIEHRRADAYSMRQNALSSVGVTQAATPTLDSELRTLEAEEKLLLQDQSDTRFELLHKPPPDAKEARSKEGRRRLRDIARATNYLEDINRRLEEIQARKAELEIERQRAIRREVGGPGSLAPAPSPRTTSTGAGARGGGARSQTTAPAPPPHPSGLQTNAQGIPIVRTDSNEDFNKLSIGMTFVDEFNNKYMVEQDGSIVRIEQEQ